MLTPQEDDFRILKYGIETCVVDSVSAESSEPQNGMVQGRWVESYPVGSGVYAGEIGTYVVVDLGVGCRVVQSPEVRLSLEAQNIL